MTRLEIIRKTSVAYKEILRKIESRRATWKNDTRNLLLEQLGEVQREVNLNWYVDTDNYLENREVIFLSFNSSPSGIKTVLHEEQQEETDFRHYVKKGGALLYSQLSDSKVYVTIQYPEIIELKDCGEPKYLDSFEPEELTADSILHHVQEFLEEMINWEQNVRDIPGFRVITK
ncbi:hypothetical protein [Hymenobacter wooponensis]|uniref:Uncharacterized protein n=1 Tax=Hymenobacter wooponensis TaxID=1525360 RepID=A0A4Z0MH54_9BACT|nr:hypothetical protein [Hymenobacter wooponensis]TGD78851.1 hypothetical protein EU557_17905 [Hymenobacter wooponensis]